MKLPKYLLHKASGRATVQYKPMFGTRRHYLPGAYGSSESKTAYNELIQQILADKIAAKPAPKTVTGAALSTMLIAYLEWAESYYGAKSKEFGHMRGVVRVARNLHGATPVDQFGPIALKQVRRKLVESGLSRKHINHQIDRLRRVFRWAVGEEWCGAEVWHNLKAVPGLRAGKTTARETEEIRPVAWEVVAQVLPFLPPMIGAMVRVHWHAGMRSDELTAMRGCDLATGADVWLYRPMKHKTQWRGKMKLIALGPHAQAAIRGYLTEEPAAFVFQPHVALEEQKRARAAARKTPRYGKAKEQAPRTRRTNDRYDYHGYHGAIKHGLAKLCKATAAAANGGEPRRQRRPEGVTLKQWMRQLRLEYWHPHQLRHSRGTITRETHGLEGSASILGNEIDAAALYAEKSVDLAIRIARETG